MSIPPTIIQLAALLGHDAVTRQALGNRSRFPLSHRLRRWIVRKEESWPRARWWNDRFHHTDQSRILQCAWSSTLTGELVVLTHRRGEVSLDNAFCSYRGAPQLYQNGKHFPKMANFTLDSRQHRDQAIRRHGNRIGVGLAILHLSPGHRVLILAP